MSSLSIVSAQTPSLFKILQDPRMISSCTEWKVFRGNVETRSYWDTSAASSVALAVFSLLLGGKLSSSELPFSSSESLSLSSLQALKMAPP
jgi:hypothetical protein